MKSVASVLDPDVSTEQARFGPQKRYLGSLFRDDEDNATQERVYLDSEAPDVGKLVKKPRIEEPAQPEEILQTQDLKANSQADVIGNLAERDDPDGGETLRDFGRVTEDHFDSRPLRQAPGQVVAANAEYGSSDSEMPTIDTELDTEDEEDME
jgi:hypothetical protein